MIKVRIAMLPVIVFIFCMCEEEKEVHPRIETLKPETISAVEVILNGNIIEDGTFEILEYGFIIGATTPYITTPNITTPYSTRFPSQPGNKISLGSSPGKGNYQYSYSPINSYTNVYHTYLTNIKGTVYGSQQTFEVLPLHIYGMYPAIGHSGDTVTITGDNFGTNPSPFSVKFYNVSAKIVSMNPTGLKVIVPPLTSSYNDVYVYIGERSFYCGVFRRSY
ncbi:MAG: IPT/TIG domain-containing protein [Bacteroidales bacterium]